ncbi:EAL domain-containing protein [Hydrogenimonas thermophila]|uniref:EAL domain-containing protein n=1 Tax=Hydrogenimonas thermophila TaxID=223786 RepID=UPI0029374125|nr:EAL domain-containing protein [Hydrogenimonas thermophila]WOE70744.1 EAL domain-containing protein [Hydrogenimonas thermophila]WOE73261.1 EAL domain-containing protein [Hydrogenimonas thermophila]
MPEITKQIIEKSFAIMANTDLQFSINITEDDLKEEYLLDFLNKMCELYSVKSSYVILEILENINNNYSYDIVQQLKDFKKAGFRLAIDDFGTENSNFTSLLKLDVDFVKIDGSFIKDIDVNIESQNIVKTIVYYANLSGIKTIAEYVHSKEVLDTILLLGVDYAQGYYFGKPEPEILDFHDFII